MLLFLVDLFILIIKIIFKILFLIVKVTLNILKFILTHSFLRFPFLLFTLGYLININFKILTTIYFIYLTHLSALKFNIYKTVYTNLKIMINKTYSSYKVSKSLNSLRANSIILSNIFLEDDEDDILCNIDDLVITKGCVFIIKTLDYIEDIALNNNNPLNLKSKNNSNIDKIIDYSVLKDVNEELSCCNSILKNILPFDIPIKNVIALTKDDLVVSQGDDFNSLPIVSLNDLCFFIENNLTDKTNYSSTYIKENIIENKLWILDSILLKIEHFFITNKAVILFSSFYLFLYYLYTASITFISLKFIK